MGSACAERVRSRRQGVLVILWVQELSPSIALQLLPRRVGVVTEPLIKIIRQAIGSRGPYQLWHRFGQHAPVLLTGFDPLLGPFPVLDVSAGAKPFQDRALGILVWH